MNGRFDDKKFYINIVITVLITYILIKCIDNYQFFFDSLNLFIGILTPFVIAFILAYIFNPIINFFEKKLKTKRTISLLIIYASLILIIIGILILTLPIIVDSVIDIVNNAPIYFNKTENFLIEQSKNLKNIDANTMRELWEKFSKMIPGISSILIGSIGEIFKRTFSFGQFIVNFVLAFIICFYILLEKEKFGDFAKKVMYIALGKRKASIGIELARTLNENVGKYFTGKILDSIIVGVLSGIGLFFLKSKYALLFGTLMCIMNMIPYFGPVIGMAPVVIINMFYSPQTALFCLIYLLIVQQVEVAFIEPKIVGGQLGLSPFLTILAVTIGGGFFGIPGMILSTPIMGVCKIYLLAYINSRCENSEDCSS
ncbi:AI-2E family transporter [Peptacetobacter hominis]|uniref:AI-2E family transporter n=1 Tax=Peptacetobacter hominis TaxID=2743610 RepID=A0A544QYN7_9FIRM|nr:AI-2E family transporter [Peptacetobacter hominis]TQQ85811.1 AI-2E family transporter [Peptacetobacter hominis]